MVSLGMPLFSLTSWGDLPFPQQHCTWCESWANPWHQGWCILGRIPFFLTSAFGHGKQILGQPPFFLDTNGWCILGKKIVYSNSSELPVLLGLFPFYFSPLITKGWCLVDSLFPFPLDNSLSSEVWGFDPFLSSPKDGVSFVCLELICPVLHSFLDYI